jgi:hypothetical protein
MKQRLVFMAVVKTLMICELRGGRFDGIPDAGPGSSLNPAKQ